MPGLLVIGFLTTFAVIIWSAYAVLMARGVGVTARRTYLAIALAAASGSYWTTFHYDYFASENTHVHGWPVPVVIFQRVDADSPWADFVGPTTLLAFPMNFALFMLVPALAFSVAIWVSTQRSSKQA